MHACGSFGSCLRPLVVFVECDYSSVSNDFIGWWGVIDSTANARAHSIAHALLDTHELGGARLLQRFDMVAAWQQRNWAQCCRENV